MRHLLGMLAVVFFGFCSVVVADQPLAWRWAAGQSLRYEVQQSMTSGIQVAGGEVSTELQQQTLVSWTVQQVQPDGSAVVQQRIETAKIRFTDPTEYQVTYQTGSNAPPEGIAAMLAPALDAMVEHPVTFQISPAGLVTNVEAPEALQRALKNAYRDADPLELLIGFIQAIAIPMPASEGASDLTWQRSSTLPVAGMHAYELKTLYAYQATAESPGLALIQPTWSVVGSKQEQGEAELPLNVAEESEGQIRFDTNLGRLHSSKLRLTIELPAQQASDYAPGVATLRTKVSIPPETEASE